MKSLTDIQKIALLREFIFQIQRDTKRSNLTKRCTKLAEELAAQLTGRPISDDDKRLIDQSFW